MRRVARRICLYNAKARDLWTKCSKLNVGPSLVREELLPVAYVRKTDPAGARKWRINGRSMERLEIKETLYG